ncbi:hypothetical protein L2E82_42793 [Cichorium intybus]|uniref:Uncharacterized protein n=3 Tax=Cichorium intybus TaxID=13427 RepID=A0ACB8ZRZ0_CICIN|nr:hypothetical protein L2E82_42787 [Cichorium intybus]KAI3698890.1 hypothetical protein L2E82_42790 [Cichorium intybus]KAI3698892.1 hypothetical protein L2E82_42793 [Cichorium intybus]
MSSSLMCRIRGCRFTNPLKRFIAYKPTVKVIHCLEDEQQPLGFTSHAKGIFENPKWEAKFKLDYKKPVDSHLLFQVKNIFGLRVGEAKLHLKEPIKRNNVVDLLNNEGKLIGEFYVVMSKKSRGRDEGPIKTAKESLAFLRDFAITMEIFGRLLGWINYERVLECIKNDGGNSDGSGDESAGSGDESAGSDGDDSDGSDGGNADAVKTLKKNEPGCGEDAGDSNTQKKGKGGNDHETKTDGYGDSNTEKKGKGCNDHDTKPDGYGDPNTEKKEEKRQGLSLMAF